MVLLYSWLITTERIVLGNCLTLSAQPVPLAPESARHESSVG